MLPRPTIPKQLYQFLSKSVCDAKYAITSRSRLRPVTPVSIPTEVTKPFSSLTPALSKNLPPRMKIDEADTTVSYLKGTGPGGQKINKTNSAVQIIHKPTGIVIKCQQTRSRSQNEKVARQLLADRVEAVLKGDQSRVAIKAETARKKKASKMKKSRRKYRELERRGHEQGEGREEIDGEGHGHRLEQRELPEEQRDQTHEPR